MLIINSMLQLLQDALYILIHHIDNESSHILLTSFFTGCFGLLCGGLHFLCPTNPAFTIF